MKRCQGILLGIVCSLCGPGAVAWGQSTVPTVTLGEGEVEARIYQQLAERVDIELYDANLDVLVKYLEERGVPVYVDLRALQDAGIEPDTKLRTFVQKGLRLKSVLHALLTELELTWIVRGEMLRITTTERAEASLTTKIYDVTQVIDKSGETESIINTIFSNIAPSTWSDTEGGPGTMCSMVASGRTVLVVSQSENVHEEIGALFDALRQIAGLAGNQPQVNLRTNQVPRSSLPKTRIERADSGISKSSKASRNLASRGAGF